MRNKDVVQVALIQLATLFHKKRNSKRFDRGISLLRQHLWRTTLWHERSYQLAMRLRLKALRNIASALVARRHFFVQYSFGELHRQKRLAAIRSIRRFLFVDELRPELMGHIMQYVPSKMTRLVVDDMRRTNRTHLFSHHWVGARRTWRSFVTAVAFSLVSPLEWGFLQQALVQRSRRGASFQGRFVRLCLVITPDASSGSASE